jgi:hypothetical protein
LYKPVPPSLTVPFSPLCDLHIDGLAFVQNHWPTEREYDKKGIIVEEMDICTR